MRYAIFLFAATLPLWPQGSTGSVTGLISDPAGAAVVNASIALTNSATAIESRTRTNEAGVFTFPSVALGRYELAVEAPGFRRLTNQSVLVQAATATRLNLTLTLGAVTESVDVTSALPLLQAETSSAGAVVNRKLLDRVPFQLAGTNRDVTSFVRLVPGVDGGVNNFRLTITGGRQHATEFLVDGVTNNYRGAIGSPFSVRPSMTSVSEFRVETAVPPAEYGRTSSGVVIVNTKSGTNDWHANLELLLRNNILDSRRYNARIADITRQAEAVGNLSGPLSIPKLYNGRNRTFFFYDLTVFRRINQPQGLTRTLATEAMRRGDFSGHPNPIFDPQSGAATGGRTLLPGNTIPSSRISQFGRAFLQTYPLPNLPTLENNFIGAARNIENMTVSFFRVDHRVNDRHAFTGLFRYNWNERNNDNAPYAGRYEGFQDFPTAYHGTLHYDLLLRPSLFNKFSFAGTNWFSFFTESPVAPFPLQIRNAFGPGFPVTRFTGQGLSNIGANVDRTVHGRIFSVQNATNWTRGAHNVKFGFRYDHNEDNTQTLGNQNGTYSFSPFLTGNPGQANTGHSFASLLLGGPTTAQMQFGLPYLARAPYTAFYVQDDWKVSRRITLNAGFRYEWQYPFTDRDGNFSNFDRNLANAAAGGRPGAMVFAGSGQGRLGRNRLVDNYWGGVGPRLGVAWQIGANTVLRAGSGIFYAPRRGAPQNTQGFSSNVGVSSLDGGITPAFYLDEGWPGGIAVKPPFINPALSNGQNTTVLNPSALGSGRLPRTYQFQANLQQRIGQAVVEAGWISTQGRFLPNSTLEPLNQVDGRYLPLGDLLRRQITDPAVAAAGFQPPYAGFRGTLAQALRPFPHMQNITYVDSPTGNTNYHALTVKYEQRLWTGLTALAAYTFSKNITDVESAGGYAQLQDAANRRAERAVSNLDVPQRLVLSFGYELPMGKGQRWASTGPSAWILGGWSLSGIFTYQRGAPLAVTIPNNLPLFNGQLRPDRVAAASAVLAGEHTAFRPDNNLTGQRGDMQLNRAAFTTPAPFTFGNLSPFLANVRAFGNRSEDLTLAKRFLAGERHFFELRSDWFNAFNRSNLNAPITDLTSVNFGRIFGQGAARVIQFGVRYGF